MGMKDFGIKSKERYGGMLDSKKQENEIIYPNILFDNQDIPALRGKTTGAKFILTAEVELTRIEESKNRKSYTVQLTSGKFEEKKETKKIGSKEFQDDIKESLKQKTEKE